MQPRGPSREGPNRSWRNAKQKVRLASSGWKRSASGKTASRRYDSKANKGVRIDGMTVEQLPGHLKEHWPAIREQLFSGTYTPQPVRRVEIPKPDGGVRKLGIPTVLDRFIQQAVMQVLQRSWDGTFSVHSYGFRPSDRHIRRWRRHSNIKPKATAGWWIWISRNFSTGSITTDCSRR